MRDQTAYWALTLPLATLLFVLAANWEYLYWKFNIYFEISGPQSFSKLLPLSILLALSIVYAKKKWEPLLGLLPILVGTVLLDGSRLNMLGFFIFLYYGIQSKAGLNGGVVGLMLYFFYKTIIFVENIFVSGQGFGLSK